MLEQLKFSFIERTRLKLNRIQQVEDVDNPLLFLRYLKMRDSDISFRIKTEDGDLLILKYDVWIEMKGKWRILLTIGDYKKLSNYTPQIMIEQLEKYLLPGLESKGTRNTRAFGKSYLRQTIDAFDTPGLTHDSKPKEIKANLIIEQLESLRYQHSISNTIKELKDVYEDFKAHVSGSHGVVEETDEPKLDSIEVELLSIVDNEQIDSELRQGAKERLQAYRTQKTKRDDQEEVAKLNHSAKIVLETLDNYYLHKSIETEQKGAKE